MPHADRRLDSAAVPGVFHDSAFATGRRNRAYGARPVMADITVPTAAPDGVLVLVAGVGAGRGPGVVSKTR